MNKAAPNDVEISVIIPTKNEEKYLGACLQAITNAFDSKYQYEIIVVDNRSSDQTATIARLYNCKVLQNEKSTISASRNKGARHANGDLLAFIDADCVIDKEWYTKLRDHFMSNNAVAAGAKISPDFSNARWVEIALFHLNNRLGTKIDKNVYRVKWIGTSNMLIKKEVFQQVGGFREDLSVAEDVDLCERISRWGDIILDKRIHTIHLRESRTLKQLFQKERWRGKNSFASWKAHGLNWREAPSILLPALFMGAFIIGIILMLFDWQAGTAAFLIHAALPFAYASRVPDIFKRPRLLAQCYVVAYTYLLGRGIALFREVIGLGKG